MSVDISLVRRQDLIMRAVDAVAFPHHDRVTIQVFPYLSYILLFFINRRSKIALTDDVHPLSIFAITRKGKQALVRNERKEFKVNDLYLIIKSRTERNLI